MKSNVETKIFVNRQFRPQQPCLVDTLNDQHAGFNDWEDDRVQLVSGANDDSENSFNLEYALDIQEPKARHDSEENWDPVIEYLSPLVVKRCVNVKAKQPPSLLVPLNIQNKK